LFVFWCGLSGQVFLCVSTVFDCFLCVVCKVMFSMVFLLLVFVAIWAVRFSMVFYGFCWFLSGSLRFSMVPLGSCTYRWFSLGFPLFSCCFPLVFYCFLLVVVVICVVKCSMCFYCCCLFFGVICLVKLSMFFMVFACCWVICVVRCSMMFYGFFCFLVWYGQSSFQWFSMICVCFLVWSVLSGVLWFLLVSGVIWAVRFSMFSVVCLGFLCGLGGMVFCGFHLFEILCLFNGFCLFVLVLVCDLIVCYCVSLPLVFQCVI
jgi:hypothetical protein